MISEELQLDAAAAESTISQIDQQLQQTAELFKVALADAMMILSQEVSVPVSADTTQATTDIAALSEQPPVDVPVTADLTDAQSEVTAFESGLPPFDWTVVADLTQTQAAIDAFEAGVAAIVLPVEADTADAAAQLTELGDSAGTAREGVDGLQGSVTGLGAAIGISEGSAKEFVSTLGDMGGPSSAAAAGGILAVAGATAGFFTEGLDAVSAGQRFALVLGDMADKVKEIDVNGLNTDMETLGIQFGSTGADMENANAKLFQFAVNAGASKDKAVEFAQQVETLAARAISLNPQLGTLSDVTETLGPKLARGGRFAAEFGLALTPAEIAARALSDTGKELTSDLTVQEKAMAGAEIASERYGATLAGTVAEGSKNAAVQAESLTATFKEAIEQIGAPLVAPILDLLREAEPDAVLIAQTLGDFAAGVLPVVGAALTAVSVPLKIIDAVIGEIPAPVLTAAAAFWAASFALDALDGALVGAALPVLPLAAAVGVAVLAVSAFNDIFGNSPPYVDNVTKAIDTAAKGFDDFKTSVHDVIEAEVEAATKTAGFADGLNAAGVQTSQLTDAILAGGGAFDEYAKRILDIKAAQDESGFETVMLAKELDHLRDSTETAAMHTLEQAVATGKLTDAERSEAEQKAGVIDGHVNWAAALDIVQPKIEAATEAAQRQATAEQEAADKAAALQKAWDGLGTTAPDVAASVANVAASTAPASDQMLALATSISAANLSADQMQTIADHLGIPLDKLKGFVNDATKALDDFVSAGLKGLPDLASAIDDVLDPKKKPDKPIIIDPKKLEQEINEDLYKINAFNSELADLHARGLDNLAKVAAARGPEFTAALTKAITDPSVAQSLNDQFGALNAATVAEGPKLRAAGTAIITANGDIGTLASGAFGDKFRPEDGIPSAIGRAVAGIQSQGGAVIDVAGGVGFSAGGAIGTALGEGAARELPPAVQAIAGILSTGSADFLHPVAAASGGEVGGALAAGIEEGAKTWIPPRLHSVGAVIAGEVDPLKVTAHTYGLGIGDEMATGIAAGIVSGSALAEIRGAAGRAVSAGLVAAKLAAGISSPSKEMMAIGQDMVAGLAIGLGDSGAATNAVESMALSVIERAHKTVADNLAMSWQSGLGGGGFDATFGGTYNPYNFKLGSRPAASTETHQDLRTLWGRDRGADLQHTKIEDFDAYGAGSKMFAGQWDNPAWGTYYDAHDIGLYYRYLQDNPFAAPDLSVIPGDPNAVNPGVKIADIIAKAHALYGGADTAMMGIKAKQSVAGTPSAAAPTVHMSGNIVVNLPPGISSVAQAKAYGDAAGQAALERLTPAAARRLVVGSKVA